MYEKVKFCLPSSWEYQYMSTDSSFKSVSVICIFMKVCGVCMPKYAHRGQRSISGLFETGSVCHCIC